MQTNSSPIPAELDLAVLELLRAHSIGSTDGLRVSCLCDQVARTHAEHASHKTELLAPLLEAATLQAIHAHSVSAFTGSHTACRCDRVWRTNPEHALHQAHSIAPVIEAQGRARERAVLEGVADELAVSSPMLKANYVEHIRKLARLR